MQALPQFERLAVSGLTCGGLVLLAGIVASFGHIGIAVAAGLLTAAGLVALAGVPYAKNRRVGSGVLLLSAAALPLFAALYALGLAVLKLLGQTAASLLLIVASLVIGVWTTVVAQRWRRHAPR